NCLWINPYVSLQSALYREGATHGYFLRRPDGTVYHPVVWSQRTERGMGLCAIVDFTNPAAAAWYRGKLEAQLALGADSFNPDLFVLWAQAGFLSGLSRYHGATAREPWRFGDEALRIFRQYARLRSRLVPYLVAYGWQASEDGVPLMRPMVMEFPDDPAGYAFDLQYCLGRELLVSPVVRADGWVTTYLPRGRWTDWWSGALHEGSTTIRRQVPLRELPLYVRENSLVVLGTWRRI